MRKSKLKVVTVIQARMTSSRLPNKVMLDLLGKPLLVRMVERVKTARLVGTVVVASTWESHDDPIVKLCEAEGLEVFRGHPTDLLDRHFQAGKYYKATAVVKIPSDVPLIDPEAIDKVLEVYLNNPQQYDYVSNLHPATYPDGNDVEIMSMRALRIAWRKARRPLEREHTTPYIWENPNRFRIANVAWESQMDYSMSHRWTIDYAEDYWFIRAVYEALYPSKQLFTIDDIFQLLADHPEIGNLNAKYAGVNWYRHHLGELRTITASQTRGAPALQPQPTAPATGYLLARKGAVEPNP